MANDPCPREGVVMAGMDIMPLYYFAIAVITAHLLLSGCKSSSSGQEPATASTPKQNPELTFTPKGDESRGANDFNWWQQQARENGRLAEGDYKTFRSRYVFAALDAVKWLTEGAPLWRDRMNLGKIGIVGHSAGADGALIAANLDPQRRFDVVIPMDGYGLPHFVDFLVPMLSIFSEFQASLGPIQLRGIRFCITL